MKAGMQGRHKGERVEKKKKPRGSLTSCVKSRLFPNETWAPIVKPKPSPSGHHNLQHTASWHRKKGHRSQTADTLEHYLENKVAWGKR